MKRFVFLLLLGSLAANLMFAVFFFNADRSPLPLDRATPRIGNLAALSSTQTASAESIASLRQAWTQLQFGDVATAEASLQAAGIPPEIIRAVISYRRNLTATLPRSRAARVAVPPRAPPSSAAAPSPATLELERRLYGDLPHEKITRIIAINHDYMELTAAVRTQTNGTYLPEDWRKISLLEKEQLADLTALLTPQELEEYQLHTSSTARRLRLDYATFQPTDEEFRAIFRATSAAEARYGISRVSGFATDNTDRITAEVLTAFQSSWPPDRFAEFKRASNPEYRQIDQLVARLELPRATADRVISIQEDLQKQVRAIRALPRLSIDDRRHQISSLASEASKQLSSALTPRGFEAYQQKSAGWRLLQFQLE